MPLVLPLLSHRDREAVGIDILRETRAEDLLRLLDARHATLDHPRVERIETIA